jgi:hypothetical protein
MPSARGSRISQSEGRRPTKQKQEEEWPLPALAPQG